MNNNPEDTGKLTFRSLLLDRPLQQEIERFTAHLPNKHEQYFHLTRRPNQSHVDDAKRLRDKGEPCAEIRYGVVGVLEGED